MRNLGVQDILPLKLKINKMPEFYMIFARKIIKMPKFYMIIAGKIFFPIFEGGARVPPRLLRMCNQLSSFFTAQCTLVHMRGLGIACRPSVRPSVCNVGGL